MESEMRDAEAQCYIPFARRGSYPVRAGNRVHSLVDGEPAFRRICSAIESASHSVWCTVAFMDPDFRMPDVCALRRSLLDEHLGAGTAPLDSRSAFAQLRKAARENAARRRLGERQSGLAFQLDPKTYGE